MKTHSDYEHVKNLRRPAIKRNVFTRPKIKQSKNIMRRDKCRPFPLMNIDAKNPK